MGKFTVTLGWILLAVVCPGFEPFCFAQDADPFGGDGDTTGKKSTKEEPATPVEMEKGVFRVPPYVFLDRKNSGAADPFADPVSQRSKGFGDPVEVLKEVGIRFPKGTSAVYHAGTSLLTVVNSSDQLELVEAYIGGGGGHHISQMLILVEYIEVEDSLYHDWIFKNRLTGDGFPLRNQAREWIKSGEATIVETALVISMSGQRAKVESIHEVIYPTEGDPPEIPNDLTLEGKDTRAPITASTSTAFETRNVGTTLEVDPVLGADNFTLDLNLAPEIVGQNGYTHWPPEAEDEFFTISLPKFHTMRVSTQMTLLDGHYGFLGTFRPSKAVDVSRKRPLILAFVRADVSHPSLSIAPMPIRIR